MRALMCFTVLIILIRFRHSSVFCEPINELEANSTSNQTIQEMGKKIHKISNALLNRSSNSNIIPILNSLENKLLRDSQNLSQTDKNRVMLIIAGIKLKVRNAIKDNRQAIENNAVKQLNINKNNNERELVTEMSNKLQSPFEKELNSFNTSESKDYKLTDMINDSPIDDLTKEIFSNDTRRVFVKDSDVRSSHANKTVVVDKGPIKLNLMVDLINHDKTPNEWRTPSVCDNFVNRTCEDIKNINRVKCKYEQRYITLDKLCDRNVDCSFESDEKNCYSQVMEQFLYVKNVEANIESSRYTKCVEFDSSGSILTNQAKILRDLLSKGLRFKTKYKYLNYSLRNIKNNAGKYDQMNGELRAKSEANNIALVMSSLALALDGALCSNNLYTFDTRRSNDLFDIDPYKEFKESLRPLTGCKCIKDKCLNCTYHYCNRLCGQKYSLTRWNCESVNDTNTISLNLLCDGKSDCFDESDENGCDEGTGYAKFEANVAYSNILSMLKLKASKQRHQIQNKLILLGNSIMKLQQLTTKSIRDLKIIKELRDKCYSMLRNIYSEIVKLSDIGKEAEEAYLFLLSINQNLGSALKLSRTGNTRIMRKACSCRNGKCSTLHCSKICVKACAIMPRLTKYYCYGKFNKSVSMNKICDDILDCGNGYDEFNCKKDEICRRHHLVILRHNLQRIGENLKGTGLGELLSTWKLKVISTLKVLENAKRPTPRALKNVVQNILEDLAVTYGSVDKIYRRSTKNYVLEVFLDISQIILESIKSCRK